MLTQPSWLMSSRVPLSDGCSVPSSTFYTWSVHLPKSENHVFCIDYLSISTCQARWVDGMQILTREHGLSLPCMNRSPPDSLWVRIKYRRPKDMILYSRLLCRGFVILVDGASPDLAMVICHIQRTWRRFLSHQSANTTYKVRGPNPDFMLCQSNVAA